METQTTIFEYISPTFKIDKHVRLIEMFAGIGSQAKALENLGVDFEHWKVIEFDQHAVDSYNAIHGTQFQTSDIRNVHAADLELVERERELYILTYSFPCQDLSLAGNGKGMKKGSGTRSGLLWEVERILGSWMSGSYVGKDGKRTFTSECSVGKILFLDTTEGEDLRKNETIPDPVADILGASDSGAGTYPTIDPDDLPFGGDLS